MSDRNSVKQDHFTPDEIIQKYGIKKTAYYERLKFLGIKAAKDGEGKAYLTLEQVELLDLLHEHIINGGTMDGFELNPGEEKPVVQSTNDVDDNAESGGQLAVKGSSELAASKSNSSPQPDSVIEQKIPETQPNFSEGMDGIIRKAAEIKAQGLAMPDLVALQLSSQMTFDDLPADLQQKVTAVKEAASPKMNPASVASDLLAQYRASR